jgi:hypothetical protein
MTLVDDEFKDFAYSYDGKRYFVRLFKKVGMNIEANECTTIFCRRHSFDGEPSSVNIFSGLKIWHYNGLRHREGDLHAYESDHCDI